MKPRYKLGQIVKYRTNEGNEKEGQIATIKARTMSKYLGKNKEGGNSWKTVVDESALPTYRIIGEAEHIMESQIIKYNHD